MSIQISGFEQTYYVAEMALTAYERNNLQMIDFIQNIKGIIIKRRVLTRKFIRQFTYDELYIIVYFILFYWNEFRGDPGHSRENAYLKCIKGGI